MSGDGLTPWQRLLGAAKGPATHIVCNNESDSIQTSDSPRQEASTSSVRAGGGLPRRPTSNRSTDGRRSYYAKYYAEKLKKKRAEQKAAAQQLVEEEQANVAAQQASAAAAQVLPPCSMPTGLAGQVSNMLLPKPKRQRTSNYQKQSRWLRMVGTAGHCCLCIHYEGVMARLRATDASSQKQHAKTAQHARAAKKYEQDAVFRRAYMLERGAQERFQEAQQAFNEAQNDLANAPTAPARAAALAAVTEASNQMNVSQADLEQCRDAISELLTEHDLANRPMLQQDVLADFESKKQVL